MRATSNADRRDASPVECSRTFAHGLLDAAPRERCASRPTTSTAAAAWIGAPIPSRIADVVASLEADIVALQEVIGPGSEGMGQAEEIAAQLGMTPVMAPVRLLRGRPYGNAIIGRFPAARPSSPRPHLAGPRVARLPACGSRGRQGRPARLQRAPRHGAARAAGPGRAPGADPRRADRGRAVRRARRLQRVAARPGDARPARAAEQPRPAGVPPAPPHVPTGSCRCCTSITSTIAATSRSPRSSSHARERRWWPRITCRSSPTSASASSCWARASTAAPAL